MAKKKQDLNPEGLMESIVDRIKTKESDNSIFVYGSEAQEFFEPRYHISTGVRMLDTIIGEGGLGTGRISEFFGPNRSGKSEIAQKTCRSFLKQYSGGLCFYFDQEMALDKKKMDSVPEFRSKRFAVAVRPTIQALFSDVEKMLTAIHEANADTPVLIVIDSIAMTETIQEQKKALKDVTVAEMGRVLSVAMRKIKPIIQETNAHLLVVNQLRSKIGDEFTPEESPGGQALKFAADYRVKTLQMGSFYVYRKKDDDQKLPPDGFMMRVETIKNKRVPPNRFVELPLLYHPRTGGISDEWAVFTMMFKKEIIGKPSGGVYSLRYGPHKTDDLLKFTKAEWPQVYVEHRDKIDIRYNEWSKRLMMEELDSTPEPVETED
jgi:RecA/RadA recombinase